MAEVEFCVCSACRNTKPLSAFPMRKVRGKPYRNKNCRTCLRKKARAYWNANAEAFTAKRREERRMNPYPGRLASAKYAASVKAMRKEENQKWPNMKPST